MEAIFCFYLVFILSGHIITFAVLSSPAKVNKEHATVSVDCGQVRGLYDATSDAYSFRGIPYASPPVDKLRWRPPVPVNSSNNNCWLGVFAATQFGSPCFQRNAVYNATGTLGSEDCLYLNIWTPSLNSTAELPVMFWIHGGYLTIGNGNWQDVGYAPTAQLAHDHNVVYVSINYRLNAFGFMSLEMLRAGSPNNTSGNYGFMDMLAGLQWVQNNIRQFGGDPKQVSLFGQSSGGTSIFALLASPLARGLFNKAWAISGSPIMNKTAAEADVDNQVFVRNTGCSDADCLYKMTPEDVILRVPWEVFPYWDMSDQSGIPPKDRFDGSLPVIDGTTAQELDLEPIPQEVANWTWADNKYQEYVRNALRPFGDVVAETALKLYPEHVQTPEFQLTSLSSDIRLTCGNDYLALVMANSFTSPVFRYIADYVPSTPMQAFGDTFPANYAFHGIDMFAYYKTMGLMISNMTDADRQWEVNVQQEVLSFVRTGSPQTSDWGTFPGQTALLNANTTVTTGYHTAQCLFWL
ncbi:PNBA-like protein [Mya arenaria]|uniref:Carboxylic ester hydrolase n=1 Tax=Mya arenaria TaxID=6604 RepID=A0ABY7FPS1_MYAAR|nr:PNBA-like protein [Mya arenaria]